MSTKSYVINFTDPTKTTITVPAGDSFGPYSNTRFTDIELLGMGHTFWGEKTNENILHMLENFASNEDLHPIASVSTPDIFVVAGRDVTKSFAVGGSPANTIEIIDSNSNDGTYPISSSVYNGTDTTIKIIGTLNATAPLGSAGAPGVPDKSSEFSPITAITGQLWYNQSTGKLLTFNQTGSPLTAGVGDWKPLNNFSVSTTAPPSASEGDFWWDSATYGPGTEFYGRNLNVYLSGWQRVVQDYIPRNGSKAMIGDLNMGSNKITSLALPTLLGDGVNKSYVDTTFVDIAGDTMTGNLDFLSAMIDMNFNNIIDVGDPPVGSTGNTNAMSRTYADGRYVNVTGDTMTGDLNFSSAGIDMGSMAIRNVGAPITVADALNITAADGVYLRRDGNTSMFGSTRLTLNGDPTSNLHAATKQYVDNNTAGGISTQDNPFSYSLNLTNSLSGWFSYTAGIPAGANYVMIVAECYQIVNSTGNVSFNIYARNPDTTSGSAVDKWKFVNTGGDELSTVYNYHVGVGSTIIKVGNSGNIEILARKESSSIAPSASYRIVASW